MRDHLAEFEELDAQLLAVDPHDQWSAKYLLKEVGFAQDDVAYPLLLDPSQTVSAMYGVAFQMRIHVEWSNRPGTFIIDTKGVLRFAQRGKTFADRPKPEKIIEVLSAF